jgi:hypothetical protein
MKKRILKIVLRSLGLLLMLFIGFIALMLNPQVLYAKKLSRKQVTVHYQQRYPASFDRSVDQALALVKQSELQDSSFRFHVFLNDGLSVAPVLKKILGDAFAWGYYNNVVLSGKLDETNQFIGLNGYNRHLARTLAHEMIHGLQAHKFGLFNSRPLKNVPVWKWEGYPEYIAYKSGIKNERKILVDNISRLLSFGNSSWYPVEVDIDEGKSFAGLDYFRYWLMIKYLIDIKHMNYASVLEESIKYDIVYADMLHWYHSILQNNISPVVQ